MTVQEADRMVKEALQAPAHTQPQWNAPAPTHAQHTCPVMPVGPPERWSIQPSWMALALGPSFMVGSPYCDA